MGGQDGFDFSRFDAVAADLDLFVGASGEVEDTVSVQRARSPVRYMRPGWKGFATNRSAVRPGRDA
ncbi:hypothetical protein, partial [Actinomadura sp. CNU-125]|uniref:hypothetical protein n=1 Tax=Actinomadura sp. CNU-125 TaxID=1904961 RepID=UPI0021CCC12F